MAPPVVSASAARDRSESPITPPPATSADLCNKVLSTKNCGSVRDYSPALTPIDRAARVRYFGTDFRLLRGCPSAAWQNPWKSRQRAKIPLRSRPTWAESANSISHSAKGPIRGVDASCIVISRYNSRIHSTDQQEFLWVLDIVVCFVPNHLLRIILKLEGNRLVRDRHNCFVRFSKNFITLMRDFNTAETLVEPVQSDLKVLLVVHLL